MNWNSTVVCLHSDSIPVDATNSIEHSYPWPIRVVADDQSAPISFGDNVCVCCTSITEGMGLAGLTGEVRGETTPSATGIEIIGEVKDDLAVNVFIEDRDEDYWFTAMVARCAYWTTASDSTHSYRR